MKNMTVVGRLQDATRGLESIRSETVPILSVYLNLAPESPEGLGARLRDLLRPIQAVADSADLDHATAMSLRAGVSRVLELAPLLGSELGHGIALFICDQLGIEEHLTMPTRVWDCAIAGPRPYLRPLYAVLDEFRRVATVVLDSRGAEIFVSFMGEILEHEVIEAEEVRKANFAGWHGLDEHRHRQHTEEVRNHLFREVADRLSHLRRDSGVDLVLIGGQHDVTEALLHHLHPRVLSLVGETFVVDIHKLTNGRLMQTVAELEEAFERREELRLVEDAYRAVAADGLAAVGTDWVLRAANRRAIALLLVQNSASIQGRLCPTCGALARSGLACAICGAETQGVPDLFEALARSVVEAGGSVEHVQALTALSKDLVAAKLRFTV